VLIRQAETYMKDVIIEADAWLSVFNKKGYEFFLDYQFPPPFAKIIDDSIRNIIHFSSVVDEKVVDSFKRNEIQRWINKVDQKYGAVRERNLKGIHIILHEKLFTYSPDNWKGFKEISPRRLGLNNVRQLYIKNIEGTYAILMYESKPSKTARAEELIMLWLDKNKWTFLTYKIDDDV
jgi:hypothetical protein